MEQLLSERMLKYPLIFVVGFLVTYLLTPVFRWLAPRCGLVDMPGERRIHKQPVPRCGVSVFFGFHAACAAVYLFPWNPFGAHLRIEWWHHFLIVSSVLLVVGLLDDRRGLPPVVKLGGQILAASLAYFFDMRVGNVLGFELPPLLDYIATVAWFLTLINAFNLIDGIDGLATGLAAIAAAGIAGSFLFRHLPGDALILFGFMGACLAFLRYNFQPASIFLGDSGSMFLGLTLAAIATGTSAKGTALTAVGVPLLAVGIPLLDTLLAVWRRTARSLRKRQPSPRATTAKSSHLFAGDTDHLHHRLIRTGLSHRATATALYACNAALVAVGLLSIIFRSRAVGIYALAFVAGSYVVVRYLAGTELWDSGMAVTEGVRRPVNRLLSVVLAPVWDVLVLSLSLAIATVAGLRETAGLELSRFWFNQIPLWVGVPFLLLVATRTYQRLWSRARPSEYMLLFGTLLAGILAAAGLSIVVAQSPPPLRVLVLNLAGPDIPSVVMGLGASHWLLWQVMVYAACAIPLVLGPRLLPRIVQDAIGWYGVPRRRASDGPPRGVLIYGAGFGALNYFHERSFSPLKEREGERILGLLDDDPLLNNRLVGGHRVLGGLSHLPDIVASRPVKEIIVTTKLRPDVQERLLQAAAEHRITVRTWQISLTPLYVPPGT